MSKDYLPDRASDESVRAYLKETLEHLIAAGYSPHDMVEFSLDKFGKKIIPYLKETQDHIHQGRLPVRNLAGPAKIAAFGIHVGPEQREQMIRDAAYFRAERRGFAGDHHEEDWLAAEQEVDGLLAKQGAILEKSLRTIASVSTIAKKDLSDVNSAVRNWITARNIPIQTAV